MNKYQMVHETVVRDIVDIFDGIKDFDQVDWIINKKNSVGSIAKRASNLILVFPVLISNSLSIQTAMVISKAIERKCVTLLQILFASINLTKASNLDEYISQFHGNLNKQLSLDDFMNAMDRLNEAGIIEITDTEIYNAIKEDMHNINNYLNSTYDDTTALTEFKSIINKFGDNYIMREAKGDNNAPNTSSRSRNAADKGRKNLIDTITDQIGDMENRISSRIIDGLRDERPNYGNSFRNRNDKPSIKDQVDYFNKQLLPQDIEKANELMPTTMMVNFTYYKNGAEIRQTGVIGVKAKLYPIDSMDIISRVASKYDDKNTLFKFIKASTREISFFRDFLFAIDKAKLDAINIASNSSNAKIFKLLERRAAKYRMLALIRKNDASPITTLVMSQDEVEYLKRYNSIDMERPNICKKIMNAYNLMCISIADESLEVVKFLFDDDDNIFEALSFDGLEKEAKDSSYKKVVNLMSKINR